MQDDDAVQEYTFEEWVEKFERTATYHNLKLTSDLDVVYLIDLLKNKIPADASRELDSVLKKADKVLD